MRFVLFYADFVFEARLEFVPMQAPYFDSVDELQQHVCLYARPCAPARPLRRNLR